MPKSSRQRLLAGLVLTFCCAGWAFSFPGMKALTTLGQQNVSAGSSFFLASLCVGLRFLVSAMALSPVIRSGGAWPGIREIQQGVGIGCFAGLGLVLQMDGANYTQASTAAFLTQGYCLWIPLIVAVRSRRWPVPVVWVGCLVVLIGTAMLAGVFNDFREHGFHLGRGETENLLGSVSFAGQILWLERPQFRGTHVLKFTWVMFVTMAVICLPVAAATAPSLSALWMAYGSPPTLVIMAFLIVICTITNFLLMNRWQPRLSAAEAGLIYCTEPVFTSVVSLFLPGWMSRTFGLEYANEVVTWNLVWGGGLILVANVLLQLFPPAVHSDGSTELG